MCSFVLPCRDGATELAVHGALTGGLASAARSSRPGDLESDTLQLSTLNSMKPQVLFVCIHNAGRSQIAAALLEHHGMGRVQVLSAGSAPAEEINATAVHALGEWGIDISRRQPKTISDGVVNDSDVVITMGCGDVCPVYPGTRYLDWDLDDPAGRDIGTVRVIRNEIDALVRELLSELID